MVVVLPGFSVPALPNGSGGQADVMLAPNGESLARCGPGQQRSMIPLYPVAEPLLLYSNR